MKMKLAEWRKQEGYTDLDAFMSLLEQISMDDISPALCSQGCEVEPDGYCSHGGKSLLLAAGLL